MPVYIGLLRAVNLGGDTVLSMEALRTLLSRSGLESVQSLLQSGNVVFWSDGGTTAGLETKIEKRVATDLHVRTVVFLRTAAEWNAIVGGNPFAQEAETDPSHLVVTLLKEAPSKEAWSRLDSALHGPERICGADRHAYIVYPDGIGRSRLTATVIEKALGTRGTSRNWNTVRKLATIAAGCGPPSRPH
jgi:uncharacterized protein (DUF1697 family)